MIAAHEIIVFLASKEKDIIDDHSDNITFEFSPLKTPLQVNLVTNAGHDRPIHRLVDRSFLTNLDLHQPRSNWIRSDTRSGRRAVQHIYCDEQVT